MMYVRKRACSGFLMPPITTPGSFATAFGTSWRQKQMVQSPLVHLHEGNIAVTSRCHEVFLSRFTRTYLLASYMGCFTSKQEKVDIVQSSLVQAAPMCCTSLQGFPNTQHVRRSCRGSCARQCGTHSTHCCFGSGTFTEGFSRPAGKLAIEGWAQGGWQVFWQMRLGPTMHAEIETPC